ncbi:MAG: hypothetical protein ACOYMB_03315 [Patescibacteria group bacterium]
METNNELFNINLMASIVKKTPAEIKFALGISLDKECHAKTRLEARKMLLALDDSDPEGATAAFKRWVDLFLKDVENASSLGQAIDLLGNCPKCADAEKVIFKKIAEFCGVTTENHFKLKVANLKTSKEIIACAFKFMAPSSEIISPSGKILLERNSIETGDFSGAELDIRETNERKLLFRIYWLSKEKNPQIDRIYTKNWIKDW